MKDMAEAISLALDFPEDKEKLNQARAIVKNLCEKYPLYGI
jgi:glycine/serine hydroxymethyltransferase